MLRDIIEIFNSDPNIGVTTRRKTPGEELELVQQFISFKKNTFNPSPTNKLAIFVEPKIGKSYPDIVFAEYNLIILIAGRTLDLIWICRI